MIDSAIVSVPGRPQRLVAIRNYSVTQEFPLTKYKSPPESSVIPSSDAVNLITEEWDLLSCFF